MNVACAGSTKEETRSASPHCPKPDEPEEPRGTAMETEAGAQGQWAATGTPLIRQSSLY